MLNMTESIRENGVRQPAIVRPMPDGGYQMLSGHRRKAACMAIGKLTIPAVVREMSDDEAIICMVEANHQRENILPSERAFSYKMQLEAMKRQGKRNDLTSTQVAGKSESADVLGKASKISGDTVRRYVRLTELIPQLLQMVDDKKIAFNPAVELSYIPHELQTELLDIIEANECTPSLSQAQRMKQAAQEGKLDRNGMELVMQEEKPQQNKAAAPQGGQTGEKRPGGQRRPPYRQRAVPVAGPNQACSGERALFSRRTTAHRGGLHRVRLRCVSRGFHPRPRNAHRMPQAG